MIFSFLNAKEVKLFAASLANDFCQRVPLSTIMKGERGSRSVLDGGMGFICSRIDKFVAEKKLNFYQRACFGNEFKWRLKDAGYSNELIDPIVFEVVKRLSNRRVINK